MTEMKDKNANTFYVYEVRMSEWYEEYFPHYVTVAQKFNHIISI